jgi:hypothetical protein
VRGDGQRRALVRRRAQAGAATLDPAVTRFDIAGDVTDQMPSPGSRAASTKPLLRDKLLFYKAYIEITVKAHRSP